MAKVFFTYAQQLYKLEYEKGLIINDKQYAEKKLKEISYYSLIGGYKQPFKHGPSGKYVRGVQFEEIVSLYYFDEELRSLFLKYILHVERQIKSQLSYHFCEKYGDLQKEYLDVNNYNNTPNNVAGINKLIGILTSAISLPSNYSYIVHHVNAYGNVPLWVAFAIVIALRYLLSNDEFKEFKKGLKLLIKRVNKECPHISESQIYAYMGFPSNWGKITLYRK